MAFTMAYLNFKKLLKMAFRPLGIKFVDYRCNEWEHMKARCGSPAKFVVQLYSQDAREEIPMASHKSFC
jgi:hypothetical protein